MNSDLNKLDIGERLEQGIRLARKRMLQEKALRNQDVIVGDGNGGIVRIHAKDIVADYQA